LTKIKVNTSWDVVLGVSSHFGPIAPVGPLFSIEGAAQWWPPGYYLHKNKFTETVRHRGNKIVQQGHDIGPIMPHLTFPLLGNPWYVKIYLLSSCEVKFSSSSVKGNGKEIGCASLWIPLPMMTCGEPISWPLAFPITPIFLSSVSVGVTLMDLLAGVISIATSMILDFLFKPKMVPYVGGPKNLLGLLKGKTFRWFLLRGLGKSIGSKFLPLRKKDIAEWVSRKAVSAVTGFTTDLLKGNPTASLSISHGIPGVENEYKLEMEVETGTWEYDVEKVRGTSKKSAKETGTFPLGNYGPVLGRKQQ